jgi:hypothetical protein
MPRVSRSTESDFSNLPEFHDLMCLADLPVAAPVPAPVMPAPVIAPRPPRTRLLSQTAGARETRARRALRKLGLRMHAEPDGRYRIDGLTLPLETIEALLDGFPLWLDGIR